MNGLSALPYGSQRCRAALPAGGQCHRRTRVEVDEFRPGDRRGTPLCGTHLAMHGRGQSLVLVPPERVTPESPVPRAVLDIDFYDHKPLKQAHEKRKP